MTAPLDLDLAALRRSAREATQDISSEIATSFCNERLIRELCALKARADYPKADAYGFDENSTMILADVHGLVQGHVESVIKHIVRERDAFRAMKPGRASQRRQIMRLRHGDNAKAIEALCKAANDQRDRANAAEAREREAWIAGRDAAANAADEAAEQQEREHGAANTGGADAAAMSIRALTPPEGSAG